MAGTPCAQNGPKSHCMNNKQVYRLVHIFVDISESLGPESQMKFASVRVQCDLKIKAREGTHSLCRGQTHTASLITAKYFQAGQMTF